MRFEVRVYSVFKWPSWLTAMDLYQLSMPLACMFSEIQSEEWCFKLLTFPNMTLLGNDSEMGFSPNIVVVFTESLLLFLTEMEPGIEWTKIPDLQLIQSCISLSDCSYIYFVTSKLKLLMCWLNKSWDGQEQSALLVSPQIIFQILNLWNLSLGDCRPLPSVLVSF